VVGLVLLAACAGGGRGPATPDSGGAGASSPDAGGADAAGTGGSGGASAGTDASAPGDAASDAGGELPVDAGAVALEGAVVWAIDNLKSIGGQPTSVLGAPVVIDTPGGRALQFNGKNDALFVDKHPLQGLGQFTVEIIFRPDAGGAEAQRFFHMQDDGSGGRVLFEMRLPGNNTWILDVFVESAGGKTALFTPKLVHPLGPWYHVAAVIDGKRAHHYVNGMEESAVDLGFRPHGAGRTSIGVRITKMYFFKGAIRLARFTPRVLAPAEFLKLEN
jgi:hypothetical protein